MPLEWIAMTSTVLPFIKKYAADLSNKVVMKSADGALDKIDSRIFPEKKLEQANEAFFVRVIKELDSSMDLPTLHTKPYEEALRSFLCNPNVQAAILAPLDGESKLDPDLLSSTWKESRTASGDPLIALPADFNWAKVAKTYQQAIDRQMLFDPNLRDLLKALSALRTAEASERSAKALDRLLGPGSTFNLEHYARAIKDEYTYLKLGSLDSDWTHYEERVRLENVYVPQSVKQALPPRDQTRDYLQLLRREGWLRGPETEEEEKQGRLWGPEIEEEQMHDRKAEYEQLGSHTLIDAIDDPRQRLLVLLGDPGLGKSTLLKHLMLRWAEKPSRSLAVLIELRYAMRELSQGTLLHYLEKSHHHPCPLPEIELDEHLKRNDSLVLFDGLDEVSPALRDDAVKMVIRFAQQYEKARVIVTTRVHAYHPGSRHTEFFRDAGFLQLTLQDFDAPEIDRFVHLWHQAAFDNLAERERYKKRLQKALDDSAAIRELAANPLLLTMMAVLSRNQDLPRDRGRLYERCAELLLKNWDLEKFPELAERHDTQDIRDKLGPDQKMRILEQIAAAMQRERTGLAGNLISQETLRGVIRKELAQLDVKQAWAVADDLISLLRERNFMLAHVGGNQYAFVHRTFLEYFCARDLKHQLEKTSSLSVEGLQELFREKWSRDEWQEILRLLCGLIGAEYAGRCVSELLKLEGRRAVFLAAECLRGVRQSGLVREARQATRSRLLSLLHFDFPYYYQLWDDSSKDVAFTRSRAVQELARGWRDDPDTLRIVKERAASDENWTVRQAALLELARGWKDDPDTLRIVKERATGSDNWAVRQAAVRELGRGWKDDPDTIPWLKERAASDESEYVRQAALLELARGWKDDPDTLRIVKERATGDHNLAVRQAAVQELARGWKDDPDTLRIVKKRATSDESLSVRQAAVQELARGWKDDPDTLRIVKRAIGDWDWEERQAAVQELARRWKDDSDTLRIVKKCATGDESGYVRQAALQELSRVWKDDPDTLRIVKERATGDDSGYVRQAAVRELARGWKDDPDTLRWLRQCATDQTGEVRWAALQEIARGWKDDPDTLRILKEGASSDRDREVRRMAVRELARGWRDDPDTLRILKECSSGDRDGEVRRMAFRELARGWRDDPDTLRIVKERAASDENWTVRQAALLELARGWKDDPDTLRIVKQCTTDQTGEVRWAALQELARGWRDDPDTLRIVKERAKGDESGYVRQAVVRELARGWKDDPDILPWLKKHAVVDENSDVRQAALQELARGWKDDPGAMCIVKGRLSPIRGAESE